MCSVDIFINAIARKTSFESSTILSNIVSPLIVLLLPVSEVQKSFIFRNTLALMSEGFLTVDHISKLTVTELCWNAADIS